MGRRLLMAALASLTAAPTTLACGGRAEPGNTHTATNAHAMAGDGFSMATQVVGRPADGLALRSVRHAPHPGYHRIVFDIGLAEGSAAAVIPRSEARYRPHDKSIEVTIGGVRHDLTGNLPLRSEAGDALGKPIPIDRPPISYLGRELVLDDSLTAYRVQLTRSARFRLHALDHPVRIVLDVENTGGAR